MRETRTASFFVAPPTDFKVTELYDTMNDKDIRETLLEGERLDEVNEHITLIQKSDGLTFGTDAYLLAAFIRPRGRARAVELGAGTGIISLLLASRKKFADCVAVELQTEFATLTERNVALNHLSSVISVENLDVRALSPARLGYEADIVFTNPPYMKTSSGKANQSSMKNIARHETAGDIGDFCRTASRLLKHGGYFYCVYRPDRLSDLFRALSESSLEPKRMTFVAADNETPPSMVLLECIKGGASGLNVTPPLILYRETADRSAKREMTEDALRVYETCALYPTQKKKAEGSPSAHHRKGEPST